MIAIYLIIGTLFATITFIKGGKVDDTPPPFWKWLFGFVLCQLTWPFGMLILLYLATDGDFDR